MDEIIDFYRKYPFPGIRPIDQDGLILFRNLHTYFRTKDCHDNKSKYRILDAGCGTGNTSISLAKHFKEASLLGIDICDTSLSIARKAADKEKINNLFFRQWDLMEPLQNEDSFDIILCLGVLHHTADMQRVLDNLKMKLEKEGELYLWIYGQHGRYHHSLNQRLLNILLKTRPLPSSPVQFVSDFIFSKKNDSILEDLVGSESKNLMLKKVFENQIWIADQFLNPNEKLLDMEGIMILLKSSGFEIKKWLCVNDDFSYYFNSQVLKNRFGQLSKYQKLIALDLLLKPDRYFLILRKK
jgi:ubiquinone/menaquinone biosynthesis C-methylase UbiE